MARKIDAFGGDSEVFHRAGTKNIDAFGGSLSERGPWNAAMGNTRGLTSGTHHWRGTSGYTPGGPGDNRLTNTDAPWALLSAGLIPLGEGLYYAVTGKEPWKGYKQGHKKRGPKVPDKKFADLTKSGKLGRAFQYFVPGDFLYQTFSEAFEDAYFR